MCIFDNESLRCLEMERSNKDKEGPAPASLSWKYSTGGSKVEKDTAVSFSIDSGAAMDWCLEEDCMDWTAMVMAEAEEDSNDYMDWAAVQFDEAIDMEIDEDEDADDMDFEYGEFVDTMDFEYVEFPDAMDFEYGDFVDTMDWELEMVDQDDAMDCD